jgi:hypothetical protein
MEHVTDFRSENLKGSDHLGELGINGKIPLRKKWEHVNWINVAQDRNQWWAVVNEVRIVGVS